MLYTPKTMKSRRVFSALYLIILVVWNAHGFSPITLRTSSGQFNNVKGKNLLDFLATPSNWPKIVLSSSDVKGIASLNVNQPLQPGNRVAEIFGLPPVLPLSVEWVCRSNAYPVLDVVSSDGVPGIASDCRMLFMIREVPKSSIASTSTTTSTTTLDTSDENGIIVDLEMSFTPLSLLAVLAVPILIVDNTLALKGLLPRAIISSNTTAVTQSAVTHSAATHSAVPLDNDRNALIKPIDKFRALMGTSVYGCII